MLTAPKILIIAGSDPSGGAGIQADIKTAAAHQVYSSSVITCLTAQNTCGVSAIHNPPIKFLREQLEMVLKDISFDVVKVGMLGTAEIIDCVAEVLSKKSKKIPLVLDTVMVSTSGHLLLEKDAVKALKTKLCKGAYIVTPNVDEAKVLAEIEIRNLKEMKIAATKIKALGVRNVLIKGGHINFPDKKIRSILLDEAGNFHVITNKKVGNKNIHGTGCTLASAIACNLAKKLDVVSAVKKANQYVYRSILRGSKVGKGSLVLGFESRL